MIIRYYDCNERKYRPFIFPEQVDNSTHNETKDFFCPDHANKLYGTRMYYNDMATLMFNSQESAIRQLFHQDGKSLWFN